jgi:hypothetical protein
MKGMWQKTLQHTNMTEPSLFFECFFSTFQQQIVPVCGAVDRDPQDRFLIVEMMTTYGSSLLTKMACLMLFLFLQMPCLS